MTQHALTERLAAAYTKALVHSPKDSVYANIEKAVKAVPMADAAPDMYEELKNARKQLDMILDCEDTPKYLKPMIKAQIKMADAALAKAGAA